MAMIQPAQPSLGPSLAHTSKSSTRSGTGWMKGIIAVLLTLCLGALYSENVNLCRFGETTMSPAASGAVSTTSTSHHETPPGLPLIPETKKKLPSFHNGGVVLFYHNPKTGGMSVRHNFEKLTGIRQQMLGYNGKKVATETALVDRILQGKARSIDPSVLFLELHGPVKGVLSLHTQLRRWRQMAAAHGTGFFAFSLVRRPMDYMISYFNFFWSAPCLFPTGCPYKLYPSTVEALRQTAHGNLQCLYWSRDITWRNFKDHDATLAFPEAIESECNAVQQVLLEEMDWVGTTDKLSNETMPLLQHILNVENNDTGADQQEPGKAKVFNQVSEQKDGTLSVGSLEPSTVEFLQSMNTLDQRIYDAVKEHYTMDMWEDWIND